MEITHLKLKTVQVNQRETWVFVLLHTNTDLIGLGELNPSAPRLACTEALQQLGQRLKGRDPRRMAAHPGFLVLEYPWGLNEWRAALVKPTERIVDSHYYLVDRPGLGVALNRAVLAVHLV